jgi:putative transposon-encoded protein
VAADSAKIETEVEVTACAVLAAEVEISLEKRVETHGHVVARLLSLEKLRRVVAVMERHVAQNGNQ